MLSVDIDTTQWKEPNPVTNSITLRNELYSLCAFDNEGIWACRINLVDYFSDYFLSVYECEQF